jgi:dTDP-4-amino-4,6-dideoxygalactose transaminase
MIGKARITDLAIFGGDSLFSEPRSTSGLSSPSFKRFMEYAKKSYDVGQFTNNGPNVRLLEARLAKFHGTKHCVALCSGFWALALAIRALALDGRNEIVMPSLTYRRMADIAAWVPLRPRFCEVNPQTLSLDRDSLKECVSEKTALILAVQPIVNCCDMADISDFADSAGVPVIFDSVESLYETVPQGKVGSFGNAECFSLHASKLLNGFEGGYVTTNCDLLAQQLRLQRTFGFLEKDSVSVPHGINAKLCEFHAAMALANLDQLPLTVKKNEAIYRVYQRRVPTLLGIRLLKFDESQKTSFKNIVFEVEDDWPTTRDELIRILNAEKVLARAYYNPPLHRKASLYKHVKVDLPITDRLATRFITMPCGAHVTEMDIERIIDLMDFVQINGAAVHNRLGGVKEKNGRA